MKTTLNPTAPEFRPDYYSHTYSYPYNFFSNPLPPPPQLPPPSPTPTRTLLLSSVPSHVTELIVRRDLEVFGDVRAVQMERVREGLVTVHFYNIRQSTNALHVIQLQHMQQQYRLRKHFDALVYHASCYSLVPVPPPASPGLIAGCAVWAQFTFPVAADGYNQGTLVVCNFNSDARSLRETFGAFGCVKELRGTRLEKNRKYVEFYDTRDAAKARNGLNGKEINGKTVVVEFSRPSGHTFTLESRGPPPPSSPQLKKTEAKPLEQTGGGAWSKQRKGLRQARNKYDPRYFIKEDEVISESSISDSRTTVMIKNIPNKYRSNRYLMVQKLLLNMLDSHCIQCNEQITNDGGGVEQPLSSYDFVYLPIDFMNKCNVGYGFVNMTSPEATMRFYKAFHQQNWEVFNSKKICEVSYARLQGVDALKEHFKNSRFLCEEEEYMPVVFDPPRDGQRLTKPMPIVGQSLITRSCLTDNECCNSSSNLTVVGDVDSDDTNNTGC
ncbi:putative RNA recognition motif domain, mei2-like RNA recognition, RNA-binding domain superfamily [Helianthus annuus]|nr:putative RNA recognition motif domain, mei2-like RNA recognition, RNA-binding domain superfamily [Helianthus annuus]KAJ0631326.1 putative RNA recognition motif domain, mei2-like RNA recognition, RNA-binding domain superfamily [Helianthus annuus]KAJ0635215.1 putative RNA recognition motif domain, mei2-like RNA recognition, RNA-binding domain superfamily [Helianthus annuus]